jgi:hypothetical protein
VYSWDRDIKKNHREYGKCISVVNFGGVRALALINLIFSRNTVNKFDFKLNKSTNSFS